MLIKFILIDDGLQVRSVFLGIPIAFDKVWHDGLIFNFRQNGVTGKVLKILMDFSKVRKQRVIVWQY